MPGDKYYVSISEHVNFNTRGMNPMEESTFLDQLDPDRRTEIMTRRFDDLDEAKEFVAKENSRLGIVLYKVSLLRCHP